jgi:multidrug resistance efflux pump
MKSNRFGVVIIIILAILSVSLALISPLFLNEKVGKAGKVEQGEKAEKAGKAGKVEHNEKIEKTAVDDAGLRDTLITAKGTVESEEEIEVSNQVMGIISEVRVREGDRVKKGQPLVLFNTSKIITRIRLSEAMHKEATAHLRELQVGSRNEDIEMARSRVNRAKVIYEKAKDEYERQKRLYQKEAATHRELDEAEEKMCVALEDCNESKAQLNKLLAGVREEEIEQARAAVEKTTSELRYYQAIVKDYTILSPIDGVVTERFQDAGEVVNIGTPILKLVNPQKLRVRAELEETDAGKVMEGQAVDVSTDAYKDKIYHGKVSRVFPVLKGYTLKTFDPGAAYDVKAQDIYAQLDDFSGLKDGMTVTVRFLK